MCELRASANGIGVVTRIESGKVARVEVYNRDIGNEIPAGTESIAKALTEYLSGKAGSVDVPVEESIFTPFQKRVFAALADVKAGMTTTYRKLAERIGGGQYARAVANALAHNPVPLIVPCHRVVRTDGGLGGFSAEGGVAVKERLLIIEKAFLKK